MEVTALPYDLPASRELLTIEDDALVTVELTLETTLHTLRGRVVDERGFGVEGALLTVSSTDPSRPVRRRTKTEDDGTFAVPALPDPPFDLTAEHPAFSSARLTRIDGTDDVEVVMSSGVRLLGRIFDDWTGESLGAAHIRLEGATNQSAKTRADGTFSFRRLPTGTYDLSFSHPDYETQTRRVVLERPRYVDRPQELEPVRLQPGGVVEGEVVDAYSQPVAGAEVAWGEPPQWERGARTRSRGTFQLRGVPSGEVWITARHPVAGEGSSSDSITVKPLEVSPGAFVQLPKSLLE